MRRIFGFEISMAIKDRPWAFQVVTLVLFSLSLTIIFLHVFARFSTLERNSQVFQKNSQSTEASFVSSPSAPLLNVHQK